MEITRVKIEPSDDDDVAAYVSITIDDCFIVHGLRIKISKKGDCFLSCLIESRPMARITENCLFRGNLSKIVVFMGAEGKMKPVVDH